MLDDLAKRRYSKSIKANAADNETRNTMMTTTTLQNETLNTLTTACTAFPSWFEFSEAMTSKGYVPTLRTFPGRSKANVAQNAKVEELVRRLAALGYAVWTGN